MESIISVACKVRRMLFCGGPAALLMFDMVHYCVGWLVQAYQIADFGDFWLFTAVSRCQPLLRWRVVM